jgi:hypothetical protein
MGKAGIGNLNAVFKGKTMHGTDSTMLHCGEVAVRSRTGELRLVCKFRKFAGRHWIQIVLPEGMKGKK